MIDLGFYFWNISFQTESVTIFGFGLFRFDLDLFVWVTNLVHFNFNLPKPSKIYFMWWELFDPTCQINHTHAFSFIVSSSAKAVFLSVWSHPRKVNFLEITIVCLLLLIPYALCSDFIGSMGLPIGSGWDFVVFESNGA